LSTRENGLPRPISPHRAKRNNLWREVLIGANTSIGFGAVVSAESGAVSIGANCAVMDTRYSSANMKHRGQRARPAMQ
jgi:carbonic anhydrase/acetyltransferase-like protein (isoleucine patch superfamily)